MLQASPAGDPSPWLRICAAGVAALASGLGSVATRGQEPTPFSLEEVVVTGSALPAPASALAVRTISREEIARSGAVSVPEILRRLPQNVSAFTEAVNTGTSFSPGAAAVALRGLNVNSTLVLLNGRRLPVFPFAQSGTDSFVDLNTLPVAAIERIEVFKDGASALYGSDAIAGVVNIVTRQRFTGTEIETQYGNTTRSDMSEVHSTLVSGFSTERFSLLVAADYLHRNSLAAVDRTFSRSGDQRRRDGADFRSDWGDPGSVLRLDNFDSFAVPRGSDGRQAAADFPPATDAKGRLVNSFDTNRFEDLIPQTERRGIFLSAEARPWEHVAVFVEGLYQRNRTVERLAPDVTGDAVQATESDGLVVPAAHPFNPFGTDLAFAWRATQAGPRRYLTETEAFRAVGGVRVDGLPGHWKVEASATVGEVKSVQRGSGELSLERTVAALRDPDPATVLNVFGDGAVNAQQTIDRLAVRTWREGRSELRSLALHGDGELFHAPAGAVRLALGVEYREEELSDASDRRLRDGDIFSNGRSAADGDRHARAAHAELAIPLVAPQWNVPGIHAFDLQAAGRYERFSDFGDTFKPRFTAALQPWPWVRLRGSYAEGFRAPSLAQLFTGTVEGFGDILDPATDELVSPKLVSGGNPRLRPETAYGRMLGIEIEPPVAPGLALGVEVFRIDQRNLIESLDPQFVVDREDLFPGAVERDRSGGLARISTPFQNLSRVVVDGVDFTLRYERATPWGTFRFSSEAQFLYNYEFKTQRGLPAEQLVDAFTLPDFQGLASLSWEHAQWSADATLRYVDGYDGASRGQSVDAWTTLDLQGTWQPRPDPARDAGTKPGWRDWLAGLRITAGVENVFDEDPPFANVALGYDSQTHDARGRFYYVALRKKF